MSATTQPNLTHTAEVHVVREDGEQSTYAGLCPCCVYENEGDTRRDTLGALLDHKRRMEHKPGAAEYALIWMTELLHTEERIAESIQSLLAEDLDPRLMGKATVAALQATEAMLRSTNRRTGIIHDVGNAYALPPDLGEDKGQYGALYVILGHLEAGEYFARTAKHIVRDTDGIYSQELADQVRTWGKDLESSCPKRLRNAWLKENSRPSPGQLYGAVSDPEAPA